MPGPSSRSAADLGEAPRQEPALRPGRDQAQGFGVTRRGILAPPEPAEQVSASGWQEEVVTEGAARGELVDQGEPGSRQWPPGAGTARRGSGDAPDRAGRGPR